MLRLCKPRQASNTTYIQARITNTGTDNTWVDCAQIGSTYSANEYHLLWSGYGNGDYIEYTYDKLDSEQD